MIALSPASHPTPLPAAADPVPDRLLVGRARRGEEEAFAELVRRHRERAFRVAAGMVGDQDTAADIVQEAFIKVHRYLPRFRGEAAFTTWLHRIVANAAIDAIRKRRRRAEGELDEAVDGSARVDDPVGLSPAVADFDPRLVLERRELAAALNRALATLSVSHRQVLLLREVEGLSYAEIARVAGIPKGTVMSRLFHARKRMQAVLLPHISGPGRGQAGGRP